MVRTSIRPSIHPCLVIFTHLLMDVILLRYDPHDTLKSPSLGWFNVDIWDNLNSWQQMMDGLKATATELRNKNKAELVKLLDEAKQELASLRVQKVAGSSSSKLQEIGQARRHVATLLTVINQTQREQLRLFYQKKKFTPLDLRVKKTRAMRRALTPFERSLKTVKEQKKALAFPARKYAVKA
ncbi:hypothetical protein [Absidia glauca]|uniref:Ribosomal protein L29 n=1 Tax=Absidia glauca TaxID=4829 RepID=A0A168N297_ABSGL|nr:hypothetical protein [Absidia glauca]